MKRQKAFRRGAGVLLPISSLPSKYGIGSLGEEAYRFVDFLKKAGQHYWQILPIGPTGYGDSPYQSDSAFSGNPYFIDLQMLQEEGLLQREDVETFDWGEKENEVDYRKLEDFRTPLLRIAFQRSSHREESAYRQFYMENKAWLENYSQYKALKHFFGGKKRAEWNAELRVRNEQALETLSENLQEEKEFCCFCQYHFFCQWKKLKQYANENGIQIIGDIPIYVSDDSADVWARKEMFLLDSDGKASCVAGVPPDEFSGNGQLWGNPLYNWEEMEKTNFSWWRQRAAHSAKLFDAIRIDHFIGLIHYYCIDANETTAIGGTWLSGPGEKLLSALSEAARGTKWIAEDLGAITPEVIKLRLRAGYPGMKLMLHAFNSDNSNENLPHCFEKNCVVYGGTHDNETLVGYFAHAKAAVQRRARQYLNVRSNSALTWGMIREAYRSVADVAVFQMQDYLELDNSARMNRPSTVGGNWKWRVSKDDLSEELAKKMHELSRIYGRISEGE